MLVGLALVVSLASVHAGAQRGIDTFLGVLVQHKARDAIAARPAVEGTAACGRVVHVLTCDWAAGNVVRVLEKEQNKLFSKLL